MSFSQSSSGSGEPPLVSTAASASASSNRLSVTLRGPCSSSRKLMSSQASALPIPSVLMFPPTSTTTSITQPNVSLSRANKQYDWQSMQQHQVDMCENVVLDNDSRGIKLETRSLPPRSSYQLCAAHSQSLYGGNHGKHQQQEMTGFIKHSTRSHHNNKGQVHNNALVKSAPLGLSRRAFAKVAVQRL